MSILLTSSHTDSYSSPPLQRNPMSSAIIAAGEYSESADKENALICLWGMTRRVLMGLLLYYINSGIVGLILRIVGLS